ncbi:DUF5995 family protein [Streptomyces sp. URMC 123]|uniref:DUF5995 family protein n=1 Tax=Streptomyces sp. URMC 123 TaxID=3423403 RepID=UPI003F1D91A0
MIEPQPTRRRPAADVQHAVERMRELARALPARDGIAVFNRVYLTVTEEVVRRSADGLFRDPLASAELSARFAERYLSAVEVAAGGHRPPACWRPLFQLRRHPGVRPLQFALAGINAHIGHDLALSVVDTCTARGCEPAEVEGDFERVGQVLTALEERIREDLMPGPDLLDIADPLTHLLGAWSLERARDAAWAAARVLWRLRDLPEVYGEFIEGVDSSVGMVGRCLLTPLG